MLSNKLKLNADKTHLITVGTQERLRNLTRHPQVQMDGVHLEEDQSKSESLLGCYIQANLKWQGQIQNLFKKLKNRLNGLSKIKWIVPFNIRKIITHSIFNSIMVYCIPVFGGCDKGQISHAKQGCSNCLSSSS